MSSDVAPRAPCKPTLMPVIETLSPPCPHDDIHTSAPASSSPSPLTCPCFHNQWSPHSCFRCIVEDHDEDNAAADDDINICEIHANTHGLASRCLHALNIQSVAPVLDACLNDECLELPISKPRKSTRKCSTNLQLSKLSTLSSPPSADCGHLDDGSQTCAPLTPPCCLGMKHVPLTIHAAFDWLLPMAPIMPRKELVLHVPPQTTRLDACLS